jgi:hypothetical protein
MIRTAAIAWVIAAFLLAGLVAQQASESTPACLADPAATLACPSTSLAQTLATPLLQAFVWPVWVPLLLVGWLLARTATRAAAVSAAVAGILGAPLVIALIAVLAHPSGGWTSDTPAIAVGLLLLVPGVLSAIAAIGGAGTALEMQPGGARWSHSAR